MLIWTNVSSFAISYLLLVAHFHYSMEIVLNSL